MEPYKAVVNFEYFGLKADFEYSISLSEILSSTRFSLDGVRGCDVGPRDYPRTTSFKVFSLSAYKMSFLLGDDTPNLLVRLVVATDTPVIFGTLVLAPDTLVTVSNRSTRSNLWGTTPWILPVDFWESRAIEQMLDTGPPETVLRSGNAKVISARPAP